MSIQVLVDPRYGACLTDTVDGMAFGPTFEDSYEAEAFIRWFEEWRRTRGWIGKMAEVRNLKRFSYDEIGGFSQKKVADMWRKAIEPGNHTPQTCPLCHPDYPYGFVAEKDASDGSGTYLAVCNCECHDVANGRDRG